ncbi:hypothetical protein D3C72_1852250 [compost metagenome]
MREQVELLERHAGHGAMAGNDSFRVANAFAVDLVITDGFAVEQDLPALELFKHVHAAQQRGLARAAGADQRHHVAALHSQIDALEYFELVVTLVQAANVQQRLAVLCIGLSLSHGKATRFSMCRPSNSMP